MKNPEHFVGSWHVKYPEKLSRIVKDSTEAWQSFCLLDEIVQDLFKTSNNFNGTGFERKVGDGSEASAFSSDNKLNFDITSSGIDSLLTITASIPGKNGEIAQNFIHSAAKLVSEAQSAIQEVGALVEKQSGVKSFKNLAATSGPNAFFRFLYYPKGVALHSTIGEPHPDNSGFTLHLYESTDGCEWLDENKRTWHPLPVEKGYATAFPSMQTQLVTNGEVDALWHRIVANETTVAVGRIAIVCFVSLEGAAQYDKNKHGRLQEFTLGDTYQKEPAEFARLFRA